MLTFVGLLQRALRRPSIAVVLIGLVVFAVLFAIRGTGLLAAVEFDAYDWLIRMRAGERPEPRVVLIYITEEDIGRFDHPLSDSDLARAIEALLAAGPRAVGIDVYRDHAVGEGAAHLREVLEGDARVVMIRKLGAPGVPGIDPLPYLSPGAVGFSDMLPDHDGSVRRGLLYLWEGDQAYVSLPLALVTRYLRAEKGVSIGQDPDDPNAIRIGGHPLPPLEPDFGSYVNADAAGYQFLLDFRNGPQPYLAFTLSQLLDGEIAEDALRDRVVLVGTAAPSVKDQFTTPFSTGRAGGGVAYGVSLHGQAVSQLLRIGIDGTPPVRSASAGQEALWTLAWSVAAALAGLRLRSALAIVGGIALGLAAIVGSAFWAFEQHVWLPLVPPALAWLGSTAAVIAWQSQRERAERNLIMRVFARYEGRKVADALWERREEFMDGGRLRPQRLTLTILMADLKGYTATAERLDPAELMEWINGFMGAMARVIEEHGGAVDDYAGDGIKANFGVPTPRRTQEEITADAASAVRCALAMGAEMERLNERWRQAERPTGKLRIGIHTGTAVVGEIGSEDRVSYKSVGDTVNTAARFESFDKDGFEADPEGRIFRVLIGEATHVRVAGLFQSERIGAFELRGKSEPVPIFRIHPGEPPA